MLTRASRIARRSAPAATTTVAVARPGGSDNASISDDGRFIAFSSLAPLVASDRNGTRDIYLHDRVTGATTRSLRRTPAATRNGASLSPAVSDDARRGAFTSLAANLAPGDSNETDDVFVYEVATRRVQRVSTAADDSEANGASRTSGMRTLSSDGRRVAYWAAATNIVAGDTNGLPDVAVTDLATGSTTRVSNGHDGSAANDAAGLLSISRNGRYVSGTPTRATSSPATRTWPRTSSCTT